MTASLFLCCFRSQIITPFVLHQMKCVCINIIFEMKPYADLRLDNFLFYQENTSIPVSGFIPVIDTGRWLIGVVAFVCISFIVQTIFPFLWRNMSNKDYKVYREIFYDVSISSLQTNPHGRFILGYGSSQCLHT